GMGEVFRAHDAVLERDVAVKVLHRTLAGDTGFVERFRREARAAAGLSHPNIVAVHDWGAVDGIYFMVMELVGGVSARDLLNAHDLLEPAQAADVLLQTLSALDHAHRRGIVHRDVKPENVMVSRDGVVKVADFGLARAYADAQITVAGTVTGTVQYLAPEQLQGEPADPRTDLYSLGVVSFELLTGRLPFTGETPMAIAYKHLHDRMPAPSARNAAVPSGLDGWVASMTEKARELRPESAAEARRDLAAEVSSLPPAPPLGELVPEVGPAAADPGPERAITVTLERSKGPRRRRRWARWAFGIPLALLAIGATAWGAWTYLLPHQVDVPQVIGMPLKDAQQGLEAANLLVRIGDGRYSRSVPEGTVLDVRPAQGTALEEGDRVTLIPSLGPRPVPVPALVGLPLDEAKATLRDAKLKVGAVTEAYNEKFPVGQVIRQGVRADEEAPIGTEIDVVVSKGPSPVPVPKVVGLTEEQAVSTLTTRGFLVDVGEKFSDEVPRGEVVSQDPPKGTRLQPGETVTLVVSKGPRQFEMPSVVGMGRDAAVAKLTALGLKVDVAIVPGQDGATVVYQEPAAGAVVKAGDLVHIYVA
ncbi:MAG TPA: Stk1 family PASTA domain-containing Ser/Thr kinase, partial [Actinomycetota bacterium]|nr:Stk1 family PASTA domain-containing Ser/Thr kinase [Actinomycetota bacterium]